MASTAARHSATPWAAPQLRFTVQGAASVQFAAVPTIAFSLRAEAPGGEQIRSLLLDVQIQIAARQRGYDEREQERLLDLFGTPERWRTTLRTVPWTRATVSVPPFTASTSIEVPVACSYDLEVSACRYIAALADGEVPLELLLSGTVFYAGFGGALQAARIGWDQELDYRMPVAVWREAMDRHFPGSAWLRLSRERFERLWAFRSRHALESWDAAVDALLERVQQ
jgi:hypothetical protein